MKELKLRIIPPGMEECQACDGKGEVMLSCCSQERVDEDYGRCPDCGEGLGEDTCDACNGKGYVPIGSPNDSVHIIDPIGAAEAAVEAKKDWIAEMVDAGAGWSLD